VLLTELLHKFELSLKRRELSPHTVLNYHWALHDLIDKRMGAAGLVEVEALTQRVLEDWQDSQIERRWHPRSRGLAITATRQFIKFGVWNDYITDAKLERALAKVKQPEAEPHPISEEDLAKIQAYLLPLTSDLTLTQLRDRALFVFILSTGARVSEALQPTRTNYAKPTVIQKGGSKKTLGVTPKAVEIVGDYLACRTDDRPELWVILATRRYLEPMNPADVRLVWKKMSKRLGLSYWTTHAIRHTTATVLLDAEIDHLVIAEHLGHHGVGTIANYAKVRDKGRQRVLGAMDEVLSLPPAA
jgi:site-specific recombinase XerD